MTGFDKKPVIFIFAYFTTGHYNREEETKSRVLPVIQKYNIPAMYLFGSYARGEAKEESDLDFLVDTTGTRLTSLLSLGDLYCDLEEIIQKKIDLVTLRSVMQKAQTESDRSFRDTVMKERVSLSDVA